MGALMLKKEDEHADDPILLMRELGLQQVQRMTE